MKLGERESFGFKFWAVIFHCPSKEGQQLSGGKSCSLWMWTVNKGHPPLPQQFQPPIQTTGITWPTKLLVGGWGHKKENYCYSSAWDLDRHTTAKLAIGSGEKLQNCFHSMIAFSSHHPFYNQSPTDMFAICKMCSPVSAFLAAGGPAIFDTWIFFSRLAIRHLIQSFNIWYLLCESLEERRECFGPQDDEVHSHQIGGVPESSSVEYLVTTKTWMKLKEEKKENGIYQTFDMERFFDKKSLMDTMYTLKTKADIDDKDYRLWYKLNEDAKICVKTSVEVSNTKLVKNLRELFHTQFVKRVSWSKGV